MNAAMANVSEYEDPLAAHFDALADEYADKYAQNQPRHLFEHEKRKRAELACQWLGAHLGRSPQAHILDVGCGNGRLICRLLAEHQHWRATGVDLSRNMIRRATAAAARARVADRSDWHVGNLNAVTGRYQAVVALGVLGYQHDQIGFLGDLAERVDSGGLLIVSFGNAWSVPRHVRQTCQCLRRMIGRRACDVRFRSISASHLTASLGRMGFQPIQAHWMCFGLGLRHSPAETRLSRYLEARWQRPGWLARCVAQVGLVSLKRADVAICTRDHPPTSPSAWEAA